MKRDRLEDQAEKPRNPDQDAVAVDLFSGDMKRKLRANVHKKHWDEVSFQYLLMRLKEEIKELEEVIDSDYLDTFARVIDEAADVANFAMMIADRARREIDQG
jgi:NTP pyrophosphatase (non-canonical NTP hydrolase)